MPKKKTLKVPKERNIFVAQVRLRPSGAHNPSRKADRKSGKLFLKSGRWADQSSRGVGVSLIGSGQCAVGAVQSSLP